MMVIRFSLALLTGALVIFTNNPAPASDEFFTAEERRMILSHGPWPPIVKPDPSNRYSGDLRAIRFGGKLFNDVRLSRNRNRSCGSCHMPERAYADGKKRSMGNRLLDRNAIALANLRLNRWFGWGGKSDNLWAQSIHPILHPDELDMTPEFIAARIRDNADLATEYRAMTGDAPANHEPERILVTIAKALAAWQETLVSRRSRFDWFRDAMVENDRAAMADFSESEKRGLKIFVGKGNCSVCHFGPNFTNGEFHNIGMPHFVAPGRVDPGRHGGLKIFRDSPYKRSGKWSDEKFTDGAKPASAFAFRQHRNWGEFRVPSLRNVARTAPYMHDGSLPTLKAVVDHYSELNMDRIHADRGSLLKPLNLTDTEKSDLIAFLKTLNRNAAKYP